MPKPFALSLLAMALVACPDDRPTPAQLPFASAPEILRGAWVGTAREWSTGAAVPVRLELTATYQDRSLYVFEGTFLMEGRAGLSVRGSHNGGERYAFVRPQRTLPPSNRVYGDVVDAGGRSVYTLTGHHLSSCFECPEGGAYSLSLALFSSGDGYSLEIRRAP